jgi:hypothetical protein
MQKDLKYVHRLLQRVTASVLGTPIVFRVDYDKRFVLNGSGGARVGRVFIQAVYNTPCTKTGKHDDWRGRKWYLSTHMTDDEIIKTVYCAVKAAVEHEMMEGFKVDGIILFNPHINFEQLLKISHNEVKRDEDNFKYPGY